MNTINLSKLIHIILFVYITHAYINKSYAESINIIVPTIVKNAYVQFLNGRDPLTINDFTSPFSSRGVVELILIQQAINLGNDTQEKDKYLILSSSNSRTNVHRLNSGSADIIGTSVWRESFTPFDHALFSLPIIESGKFEAGLYTLPTNSKMLTVNNKRDLNNKSTVSNRNWPIDWQIFKELNVNKVWHTENWAEMLKMVGDGQVDFLLIPFQANKNMAYAVGDKTLMPVPKIKVTLNGTRHFAISKRANNAQQLLDKVNRGLTKLMNKGMIEQAYVESGFFNQQVKNWTVLNKP